MNDDVKKAKQIYKNMNDNSLIHFAEQNYKTLRPEILPVLLKEIQTRNLANDLIDKIHSNSSILLLDEHEVNRLITKIQNANCPICNKSDVLVNCYNLRTVVSYVFSSIRSKRTIISCKSCYQSNFWASNILLLAFGWFSISGLFSTPYAFIKNLYNYANDEKTLRQNFISFILSNYKELKANEENIFSIIQERIRE